MVNESLDTFLADFGVSCSAGAISSVGILDMPGQVLGNGMVISTDYTLTARAADFGGLLYGDTINVAGQAYQVREVRKLDDGALCEIALQKVTDGIALDNLSNCSAYQIAMDD